MENNFQDKFIFNSYGEIKPNNIVSVNHEINFNVNPNNKKSNYLTIVEFIENEINPGIIGLQEQEEINKKKADEPEQQTFWQKYVK